MEASLKLSWWTLAVKNHRPLKKKPTEICPISIECLNESGKFWVRLSFRTERSYLFALCDSMRLLWHPPVGGRRATTRKPNKSDFSFKIWDPALSALVECFGGSLIKRTFLYVSDFIRIYSKSWRWFAMPIYEFQCLECSLIFDEFVGATNQPLKVTCPGCHSERAQRLMSAFGFSSGGKTVTSSGPSSCSSCTSSSCAHCH